MSKSQIGDEEMDFDMVFETPTLTPDRGRIKEDKKKRQGKRRPRSNMTPIHSHEDFVKMLSRNESSGDQQLPFIPRAKQGSSRRGGRRRKKTMRKTKKRTNRRKKRITRRKKTRRSGVSRRR